MTIINPLQNQNRGKETYLIDIPLNQARFLDMHSTWEQIVVGDGCTLADTCKKRMRSEFETHLSLSFLSSG